MKHLFFISLNKNSTTMEELSFTPVSESPPFPFNLDYSWRLVISMIMVLILLSGIFLRVIIIGYLVAPSTKIGPINLLIWVDQLNGIFLAFNIVGRIFAFVLPFPLTVLTGDDFCQWSPLPGKNGTGLIVRISNVQPRVKIIFTNPIESYYPLLIY